MVHGKVARYCFCLMLLTGWASQLWAEPLRLAAPAPLMTLVEHAQYWCDGTGEATFDQARQQAYQPVNEQQIAFGYRRDACWFRFDLENTGDQALDLVILADYGLLDEVDLYHEDDDGERLHWALGDRRPMSNRPLDTPGWLFPVMLSGQDTDRFYLRLRTTSSMTAPLLIGGSQAFIEYRANNNWLVGLFYGIGFGLVLYHLVLWVRARERIYRFYVLHVITGISYLSCLQGYGQHLWPDWVPMWDHFPYVVAYLSMASASLFARDYLGTAAYPGYDRLLVFNAYLMLSGIAIQLLAPEGIGVQFQGALAVVMIFSLFLTGLMSWYRGHAQARIFVLAWGLFLTTVILLILNTHAVLGEVPVLLTLHGMHIGVVIQQVLLSFGLAARLSDLKNEAQLREGESIRARAENASKSEFLARMSHEIRTPMNAVVGLTELLTETPLNDEQKRYVNTISSAGNNLLEVINDVLDYSKIEAGKLELSEEPFRLPQLINECVTMFVVSREQDRLHLFSELDESLPEWVQGDQIRLRQVLVNLLGNAVKFTAQGTVILRASVRSRIGSLVRLQFEVEDSGIGIDPNYLDELFKPFSQVDGTMARRYGGSGLGLAICRQLVDMMHGDIEVESELGRGATFRFTVLLGLPEELLEEEDEVSLPGSESAFSRVLVVEDNPVNQMVIKAMLDRLGVDHELAESGAEALKRLESGPADIDLVLMDCEMPVMDGYQATSRIRLLEVQMARQRLPIIALTAHALPEHRQLALEAGMDDYLAKPLTLEQLRQVLQRWGRNDL